MNQKQLDEIREQCDAANNCLFDIRKYSDYADNFPAHYAELTRAIKTMPAMLEYTKQLKTENAELKARLERRI